MSPSARSSILPHLALMLSMLVWSSTFIGLKIALSAYSPASAMALRMGSAALLCLPLLPRLLRAMKHPAVRRVLLFGVLVRGAGLAVAAFVLVMLSSYASRKFRLGGTLLLAVGLTLFAVVLFVKLPGLPMPILGPWLTGD